MPPPQLPPTSMTLQLQAKTQRPEPDATNGIRLVHTPQGLQDAVRQGHRDIEVRQHLDLRDLKVMKGGADGTEKAVLLADRELRSLRVRLSYSPALRHGRICAAQACGHRDRGTGATRR